MCEKAEEIQKYWTPKVLDYYCKKANCNEEFIGYVRVANKGKKDILRKNYIWLPMEGQLIEELLNRKTTPKIINKRYEQFLENLKNRNARLKDSFRSDKKILDLIFAMNVISGKRWSSKKQEWI